MTLKDLEIIEKGLQSVANSIGRIVAKDNDGYVIDSGSLFFAQLDGQKFIVTAEHVVSGLLRKGGIYIHVFQQEATDADLIAEALSVAVEFYVSSDDIFILNRGEILDIVAIKPPSDIEEHATVKWFELDGHAEVFDAYLKPAIEQNRNPRLAAIILGFPSFFRVEDSSLRIQLSGMIPMWAFLERVSHPPNIFNDVPPQVIFELEPLEKAGLPVTAPSNVFKAFQQFEDMCKNGENVLGGYSGCPLIYFCEQGAFLVGIIKQGGMALGGQGFATPIDTFVESIRNTPGFANAIRCAKK